MQIKNVAIKDINPAKYNPRIDLQPGDAEYDKLVKVMDEFDLVEPLVWNKRTGNLVGGHQRLKILLARGDKQVKVSVVDLPLAKEKALNIALNKTGGDWDLPILRDLLMELDTGDFDMELTGFGEDERGLLMQTLPGEVKEEPVPEAPDDPITKYGDLWLLGEHRVLCGDSTSVTDVEKLMGGGLWQLLVTDPPYGVSYADKNKFLNAIARGNRIQTPIEGDHKKPEEMGEFWREVFGLIRTFAADGASYYVTGPQGGDLLLLLALKDSDFPLRHMLIWAKNNHVLGRSDYNYKHEPIIFGWVKGTHKFYGTSSETSLWEVDKPHSSKLHPTMKPVELFSRAIANSSKTEDAVFDPFLGSGTTLIAAEQLGRKCYGIELDPRYCDVIVQRWENLTGKKATLAKD